MVTADEEFSGTVAHSEEDDHIYDDHEVLERTPNDPYYTIIFDEEVEVGPPTQIMPGTSEGETSGPYYSVIERAAATQNDEEVVYHYAQFCQDQGRKELTLGAGEGYVNVGSGTKAMTSCTMDPGVLATHYNASSVVTGLQDTTVDYINVDPGALATHYTNVDASSMVTGLQDTTADYINVEPDPRAVENHNTE